LSVLCLVIFFNWEEMKWYLKFSPLDLILIHKYQEQGFGEKEVKAY
jgi:hypothetical protein